MINEIEVVDYEIVSAKNSGCFPKGHEPWNKGLKGIHLSPSSEFKKGEIAMDKHPSWKGGVQIFTKDCAYVSVAPNKRLRRPRKVYEETVGLIPPGWVLFHIDGDRFNDDIDNLIAIPRAILVEVNAGRIGSNYHQLKIAVELFNQKQNGK